MANYLKDMTAGAVAGGAVGTAVPVVGTAVGAGVGALGALMGNIISDIKGFSSSRARDQQILNNMAKAGYKIQGPLPKGLKQPPFVDNTPDPSKPTINFSGTTPYLVAPQGGQQQAQSQIQGQQGQAGPKVNATPGLNWSITDNQGNPIQQSSAQNLITGPSSAQLQQQQPMDVSALNKQFGVNYNPQTGQASVEQGRPQGNFWSGTPAYDEKVSRFKPNQEALQDQYINELRNNPVNFNDIARASLRQYEEEIAPRIAEQYYGATGGQFSSAYPLEMFKGARSLAERLNAAKAGFAAEREGRLMNTAMQPSFDIVSKGAVPGLADHLIAAIPGLASGYMQSQLFNTTGSGSAANNQQQSQSAQPTQTFPVDTSKYLFNQGYSGTPEDMASQLTQIGRTRSPWDKLIADQLNFKKKRLGGGLL